MKDFLDLLKKVFGRNHPPRKNLKYRYWLSQSDIPRSEGVNINPTPESFKRPDQPPGAHNVKKKERIDELEKEVADLKEQLQIQAELMVRLARDLSELNRDVAHLLPEQ